MKNVTEKNLTECRVFELLAKAQFLNKMLHYKNLEGIKNIVGEIENLAWESKYLLEQKIEQIIIENDKLNKDVTQKNTLEETF